MRSILTFILYLCPLLQIFAQTNKYPPEGSVGIGTMSPSAPLEIVGTYNSYTQARNGIALRNNTPTNFSNSLMFLGNNTLQWSIANDLGANGSNNFYIASQVPTVKIPFYINENGFIGMGNTNPAYNLDVNNYLRIGGQGGNDYTLLAGGAGIGSQLKMFYADGTENTRLAGNNDSWLNLKYGNVGIGTSSPDSKLTVKGKIHAEEIKVDLSIPAPDYVFHSDYAPLSLNEIEAYVTRNRHLPEIPSAAEMEKDGINLSEMNMKLLKKIEELTLYLIEQNREMQEYKKSLNELQKSIELFKTQQKNN